MTAEIPQVRAISAFSDNYIWSIEWADRSCAVVDPGDAAPVLDHLSRDELELVAIIVTHHHADHIGGIPRLLSRYPAPVYGPASGRIQTVDHPLRENDSFRLKNVLFRTLEVAGHTRDHIALVTDTDPPLLFCGDTLFGAGCGRLFEGTPAEMYRSLHKIAQLPDKTKIFCAHEYTLSNLAFALDLEPDNPELRKRLRADTETRGKKIPTLPSCLALERETNPFLRCDHRDIILAAKRIDPNANDPIAVFAAIRELKNRF